MAAHALLLRVFFDNGRNALWLNRHTRDLSPVFLLLFLKERPTRDEKVLGLSSRCIAFESSYIFVYIDNNAATTSRESIVQRKAKHLD
jgi:hypothetical protein